MRVVFIAGPFRGPTPWDIAENVRRAERLGLAVAQLGAMPLIPHANTALFHGQGTEQFWLDGTLELLRRSDAVMLTENWRDSVGGRAEREHAIERGIPVFSDIDELEEWLMRPRNPAELGAYAEQWNRRLDNDPWTFVRFLIDECKLDPRMVRETLAGVCPSVADLVEVPG